MNLFMSLTELPALPSSILTLTNSNLSSNLKQWAAVRTNRGLTRDPWRDPDLSSRVTSIFANQGCLQRLVIGVPWS
uniref:Uncharacterized protein n=1 Tax=Anguilla anguilla TaxID=7936 RepID=A0A0E9PNN5_ANGAN